MARTPKDPTPDTTVEQERIKLFERRLQNPYGRSSLPIELRDASMEARWFNAAINADKIWRAKQDGWSPVRPEDVVDLDQVGGYVKSPDGFVTRGDRGQEVLMAMPKTWRQKIAMAKTRENLKNMGDPVKTKNEVVQAASDKLGDQAADFLNRRVGVVGGVTDQYERIERQGDALD